MEPLFYPKLFSVLKNRGYSLPEFKNDLLAGIIVGIVALPLAIAFAVASGVSPEKGLITAVVAGFIISLLGGSRVQIGGPTGAFIVIVYGILIKYGIDGLIISTIMAGVMLIILGLLRFGTILKFIPHPLIVGFTAGIAVVIFTTQIKDAMGIGIEKMPAGFAEKWHVYFTHLSEINYWALVITIVTILIGVYFKKITSKIPGSIVAILIVTSLVYFFKIPVNTIETVFGSIPSNFTFTFPHFSLDMLREYMQPAFTIALLGAIESLLSAVVADGMIGSTHRSNTELIAQGIANIVTPFFGGIPATGAIARTATNVKNGGRTPIAGIVHAITLLLIMLFLGNLALHIPLSCLAGILIVVSYNMSEYKSFFAILRSSKYEILVLLTSFLLTVFVDLTVAIEVGMVLAALLFMQRMSKYSNVEALSPEEEESNDTYENYAGLPKEIEVYEIRGPFFFAAAKKYQETLKDFRKTSKVIIIRMRHVPFIDSSGIKSFSDVIKHIQSKKIKVILSGVNDEVRNELHNHRIDFMIGRHNIFNSFEDATEDAKKYIQSLPTKKTK